MLCVYEGRKLMASWRRPPGRRRNVWLNKVQEENNALLLSTQWRPEIAGVMEGTTVHLDHAMMMMMMKDFIFI